MASEENRPKRKRRWLSYSLRSFLVVLTIGCLLLGYWVHRAERQNAVRLEIIQRVKRIGGDIIYVDELPTTIDSYRSLLRQSDILPVLRTDKVPIDPRQIAIVDLRSCTVSDADLKMLRRLRETRYLDLSLADLSRDAQAHLGEMSTLVELDISGLLDETEYADLRSKLPTTLIHRYSRMGSRSTTLRFYRRRYRAHNEIPIGKESSK